MWTIKRAKWAGGLRAAMVVTSAGGCGKAGPKTHTVKGTVTLDGADVSKLAGHSVEGVLETDPTVRASGVIQKDGSFQLVSLLQGEMRDGAAPGKYWARIIASDDPDETTGKKPPRPPLAARYYRVETANLSFVVGEAAAVQLPLSARGK